MIDGVPEDNLIRVEEEEKLFMRERKATFCVSYAKKYTYIAKYMSDIMHIITK